MKIIKFHPPTKRKNEMDKKVMVDYRLQVKKVATALRNEDAFVKPLNGEPISAS